MKGYIRNIVKDKPYGFIRADTGLDSIFFHKSESKLSWEDVVEAVVLGNKRLKVRFELMDGDRGPRASKVMLISDEEYKSNEM